jgi:sugar phosphate isomerase/epimerase
VPGLDGTEPGLSRFTEACSILGDFAKQRQIRLCVEHVPGRSLDRANGVLDWLAQTENANLSLLLDVGHCLISKEDPGKVIDRAGPKLGYVHLDDNDGVHDHHWPLLTGRLTRADLHALAGALRRNSFAGGLALELSPNNTGPIDALRRGKEWLENCLGTP